MIDISSVGGFQIVQKLGSGGYGEIFSVEAPHNHQLLALKTENLETKNRAMSNEIEILKYLPEKPFFPRVISSGTTSAVSYFVMPLYGPSLSSIRHNIDYDHFSLPTVFRIAAETIRIIETLHKCGVVHCDIKPSNFLLNQAEFGGFVLIDFGLSAIYRNENGQHISFQNSEGFRGTLKYASVNVHKMVEITRRDDIISWFYTLIELAKGKLPWKDVQDHNLSMSCKQSISPDKLCSGLPRQMKTIWNSIKDLKFNEDPNYDLIKLEIQRVFVENEWDEFTPYDWEVQPEIILKLTPHPELFDKNLMRQRQLPQKKTKKKCLIM
ncbi:CK1 family protein kinase [Tritrichomonas foetus]|uniref:non-specific serine/threonine protein kinase n=1 Tax=Tritrichomonas foetus TaxID=1144522 RepID=A0A1J4K1X7_9EUKA|nr:CK1 family protein kinase [Tritrichomonas foetus]|eukprot:OHT04792.1 CK1 family protein kinase [Tritrichomonas foetus]